VHLPTFSADISQRSAKLAAAGFGVVAAFQLRLALVAPWGRATLGGYNDGTLPPELRVVSSVSMAVFTGAAFVVLGRAGQWVIPRAAVFTRPVNVPHADGLLAGLGCDVDEAGVPVVDATGRTSTAGVWAAGT